MPKTLDFKKQLFKEVIISAGTQASIKDVCDLPGIKGDKEEDDDILIQLILEHNKDLNLNQPIGGPV